MWMIRLRVVFPLAKLIGQRHQGLMHSWRSEPDGMVCRATKHNWHSIGVCLLIAICYVQLRRWSGIQAHLSCGLIIPI